MPVIKKGSDVAANLGMMSTVMDGYLRGEETAYQRRAEEKDYALRVDMFEEQKSQFDLSYSEGVRRFDTDLEYREEQADLTRDHQVLLQDDMQSFSRLESEKTRTHQSAEKAKDRSVNLYRINEDIRMKNLSRSIQQNKNKLQTYRIYLDEYDSYEAMPGEFYVDKSGNRVDPSSVDLQGELMSVVGGTGSDILAPSLTAEQAANLLDTMPANPREREAWAKEKKIGQYFVVESNQKKLDGLTEMTIRLGSSGGDREAWDDLSEAEKAAETRAIIHEMNGFQEANRKLYTETLEMDVERQNALDGSGAYSVGGSADQESLEQGEFFRWDPQEKTPVSNGRGSKVFQDTSAKVYGLYVELANNVKVMNRADKSNEEIAEVQGPLINQLNEYKQNMRQLEIEANGDGSQTDKYFDWLDGVQRGEPTGSTPWVNQNVSRGVAEAVADPSVIEDVDHAEDQRDMSDRERAALLKGERGRVLMERREQAEELRGLERAGTDIEVEEAVLAREEFLGRNLTASEERALRKRVASGRPDESGGFEGDY